MHKLLEDMYYYIERENISCFDKKKIHNILTGLDKLFKLSSECEMTGKFEDLQVLIKEIKCNL